MTPLPLIQTMLYACPHCAYTTPNPHQRLAHLNTAHADPPPPVTLFEKYLRRAERRFAERQAAEQKARRR